MSKCRLIDMKAYTRGEIRIIGEGGNKQTHELHGEFCPVCGQPSFFPDLGCWKCLACGFNFCDARR